MKLPKFDEKYMHIIIKEYFFLKDDYECTNANTSGVTKARTKVNLV